MVSLLSPGRLRDDPLFDFQPGAAAAGHMELITLEPGGAGQDALRHLAELFFKHLEGGDVEITASYPAGEIKTTLENLKAAAEGEKLEWGTIYPKFAEVAEKEGFEDIAQTFRGVSKVEKYHERRFRKLIANLEQGKVFKKDTVIKWKCRNCGFVYEGKEAPEKCPVCSHPRAYFEVWCENY